MAEKDTETRKRMEETISSLGKDLATITEDFQKLKDRLDDVEQAVGTLRTDYETARIQTKQDIDEVKEAQKQTKEKVDELTNTNTLRRSIPTEEGKTDLVNRSS